RAGEAEGSQGFGRGPGLVDDRDVGGVGGDGDLAGRAFDAGTDFQVDAVVVERERAEGGGPPGGEVVALPAGVDVDVVEDPRVKDEASGLGDAGGLELRRPVLEDRG